jgi:isoleucyl-tRNA synthetase
MSNATPAPADKSAEKSKYRSTLNLPQTSFPMKASLVQNEPASLKRWQAMNLYSKLREQRAGKEKFVFHDGPPYANGSIHLGHLMNKMLKDFVVRSKTMQGLDVPYVPGWDCHGLPIEHKVMTEMQEKGKLAKLNTLSDDQRKVVVRRECQTYAEKYVKLHKDQMQRLLTMADYEHPYLTMVPSYEGATLEVLAGLMEKGLVYRQLKPVHWSPTNETALADAELEYHDREDPSIYVDFEAADTDAVYDAFGLNAVAEEDEESGDNAEDEASAGAPKTDPYAKKSRSPAAGVRPHQRPTFMIWTTTPWTLAANLAIAVNPKYEYALVFVDGNISVMAKDAIERVTQKGRSEEVSVLATTTGDKLVGLRYRHPFVSTTPTFPKEAGGNPANCYKIVAADYVTLEDGTGLVHTAPGHGAEDYQTGLREQIPVYCPVTANGTYDNTVPEWLRGKLIWDANKVVIDHLRASGHMFHDHMFSHSYPHDWRSKTPVMFRATEQWFVGVNSANVPVSGQKMSLREMALEAVSTDDTSRTSGVPGIKFVPDWGRNRMRGMLESRPDWCISRQRAWGLPIPAFFTPEGHCLMTAASVRAVAKLFREQGSDAWFTRDASELLKHYDWKSDAELREKHPDAHAFFTNAESRMPNAAFASLRKGNDILDVWFESGSSWNAVMRERNLGYPIDLYLEGSDQHRGWFQLSLLPALGVTGRPPFKTLLTHGFMVDRDGKKLSKSRPDAHRYEVDSLCTEFGMDVMRWWVASLAYENDVKVDVELFALAGESYRKVRNTLRFMLSNLYDFDCSKPGATGHCVDLKALPATSIDRWILAEFDQLAEKVVAAYNNYDFQTAQKELFNFCNDRLSATYLAAVKDRLYCDKPGSDRRRATQTTLWDLTDGLCKLLAPILPHTADEAYRALLKVDAKDTTTCIHLEAAPMSSGKPGFGITGDPRWAKVIALLEPAQRALEQAKTQGVDNPLDAGLALPASDDLKGFNPVDIADLLGVSLVKFDAGVQAPAIIDLRSQPRCERSWKRDGTVKQRSDGGLLSDRDALAVGVA